MYGGPFDFYEEPKTYPLHELVSNGKLGEIKTFLSEKTYDINTQNQQGQTALHLAVICNQSSISAYLLTLKKINPALVDEAGKTPLDLAIESDNETMQKLLRDAGKPTLCSLF